MGRKCVSLDESAEGLTSTEDESEVEHLAVAMYYAECGGDRTKTPTAKRLWREWHDARQKAQEAMRLRARRVLVLVKAIREEDLKAIRKSMKEHS